MGQSTCSVDDCTKFVTAKDLCGMHYNRLRKTGSTDEPVRTPLIVSEGCKVEDCERPRRTQGMCSMHYQRWHATGTTDLISRRVERPCSVEGCDQPFRTRDLCAMHYARLLADGTTDDPRLRPKPTCKADEPCTTSVIANGLCGKHYRRQRIHGTTTALPKLPTRTDFPCKVEACTGEVRSKGLCNAHYQQANQKPKPERKPCTIDGCPNLAVMSSEPGWCSRHLARWRDTGSPLSREKPQCSIEDCDQPVNCRGWCKKHYGRWRMHGDPTMVKRYVRPPRTEAEIAGVGEKTCATCNEAHPLEDFPKRRETPDGRGYACRDCLRRAAYRKKYAEDAEFRMRRADHFRKHREGVPPEVRAAGQRAAKLHAMYGITPEQFDRMSEAQGHVCAICRRPPVGKKYLSVDHHHETRQVRGLLCDRCNVAIGLLDEDPDRLMAVIEYLKNPPALSLLTLA